MLLQTFRLKVQQKEQYAHLQALKNVYLSIYCPTQHVQLSSKKNEKHIKGQGKTQSEETKQMIRNSSSYVTDIRTSREFIMINMLKALIEKVDYMHG